LYAQLQVAYNESLCNRIAGRYHSRMAKKRNKPVEATYQDRHTSPRVVFYLPPALLSVVDSQADAADRTRTAEIIRALKGYYAGQGLWPPADDMGE